MMINRRRVCGGKSLPYDAEIEYLESTGTQYINTGFINTLETDFEITFQLTDDTGDKKIIGQGFKLGLGYWVNQWRTITSTWRFTHIHTDTIIHTAYSDTEHNAFYLDSTILSVMDGKAAGTYPMLIFAASKRDSIVPDGNCAIMRLYSCKIYDNGIVVRDYIPVRVGSTGYMYDKVSGQLFGNAGTGAFILGPDV